MPIVLVQCNRCMCRLDLAATLSSVCAAGVTDDPFEVCRSFITIFVVDTGIFSEVTQTRLR